MTLTGLNVPNSHMYRKYIHHIYLPPPPTALPLTRPVLHSCPSLFVFIVQWGFCLGVLPVIILYFSKSNPLYYSSLFFSPTLYCSIVFIVFCCVLFLHRCDIFQYYSLYIILFFFSSSLSLL
jgi:hypothetical protein